MDAPQCQGKSCFCCLVCAGLERGASAEAQWCQVLSKGKNPFPLLPVPVKQPCRAGAEPAGCDSHAQGVLQGIGAFGLVGSSSPGLPEVCELSLLLVITSAMSPVPCTALSLGGFRQSP